MSLIQTVNHTTYSLNFAISIFAFIEYEPLIYIQQLWYVFYLIHSTSRDIHSVTSMNMMW